MKPPGGSVIGIGHWELFRISDFVLRIFRIAHGCIDRQRHLRPSQSHIQLRSPHGRFLRRRLEGGLRRRPVLRHRLPLAPRHAPRRHGGAQRQRASTASSTTSRTASSAPSSRTTWPSSTGGTGIGVISDTDDQPLIIGSHLGTFAIVTVGMINEPRRAWCGEAFDAARALLRDERRQHQPHRAVATLINEEATLRGRHPPRPGGHRGLLLAAAADRDGHLRRARPPRPHAGRHRPARRRPAPSARRPAPSPTSTTRSSATSAPARSCASPPDGVETRVPPGARMQICAFLWVYYGYPASELRGHQRRGRPQPLRRGAGRAATTSTVDFVAGIPDSGIGHAIGYATGARHPLPAPVRQVHAHLAAQLHAPGPAASATWSRG